MFDARTYRRLRRRGMVAATGALLAAPSIVRAQSQNGVALVICKLKCKREASLPHVRRDAPRIAEAFKFAEGPRAGSVLVNTYGCGDITKPFGGKKQWGQRLGQAAECLRQVHPDEDDLDPAQLAAPAVTC
jgi:hypothetical protein